MIEHTAAYPSAAVSSSAKRMEYCHVFEDNFVGILAIILGLKYVSYYSQWLS